MKEIDDMLFTCPDCGAIFPPDRFCAFCGYKIPVKVTLDFQMKVIKAEDELNILASNFGMPNIKLRDSENCSPESHYFSAELKKFLKNIPSGNGEIKFCQKCGKKLPEAQ
mgnify:CR=1 FL=1